MEIVNRYANIRSDICYRITSKGSICDISKNDVLRISAPFDELKKEGNLISNIKDLTRINENIRQNHLAKMRVLKKEQNGGYILIGSLTCMGTLILGTIIFMTIKFILIK